jgi:hypothetical protein
MEESFLESEKESLPEESLPESEETLNPNTGFQGQPIVLIASIMAASLYIMFIIFKKREIGFWY